MAEFHKNQIAWQAPEAQKVSLVKPDNGPLAEAFGNLGRMADNVAKSEMGYLDNQMVSELDAITAEMNQKLSEADSLDADYSGIVAEAMAKWDAAFGSYDAATQRRFTNNNPNAREAFQLDIGARALKKEQDQIYNRSKLDIAQWSTDVVTAPAEMQDAVLRDRIAAIQNLGLPISQTDDLVFRLRSEVDTYSIANAIANGDFQRADYLLKNELPTKGAAERAQLYQQLQNAIKQDSYEKAYKEKLLRDAKEQGTDVDTEYILKAHQDLLAMGDLEGANNLRNAYYAGADIPRTDDDGKIVGVVHTSQTSSVLRDKVFEKMKTSAGRSPWNAEYGAQYLADFNRLAAGFMKSDGSLELEEDAYVSPEQYNLAKSLRKKEAGWRQLDEKQRTFVDNVLRSYGTEEGLYMIDLNRNARMGNSSLGIDYVETNPVVNYETLLKNYSSPANIIAAAVKDPENTYAADTLRYFVDEYKKKKFTGNYEIEDGSRADALVTLFVTIATKNNPTGMSDAMLEGVPRSVFEDAMVQQMVALKENGLYEVDTTYNSLVEDFKVTYRRATGHEYVPEQGQDKMPKYITLAYQSATQSPSYSKGKAYDQDLIATGRSKRKFDAEMSKQRAQSVLSDLDGRVTTYETKKVPQKEPAKLPKFEGALMNHFAQGA